MTSLNQLRKLNNETLAMNTASVTAHPPANDGSDIKVHTWYHTVRNGIKKSIYVIEVRREMLYYKDHPDNAHVLHMSLAKFRKFYK